MTSTSCFAAVNSRLCYWVSPEQTEQIKDPEQVNTCQNMKIPLVMNKHRLGGNLWINIAYTYIFLRLFCQSIPGLYAHPAHTICLHFIVKGHQQSILERKTASNSFLHTCTHGQRQSHKTAFTASSYSSLTNDSDWLIGTCHFFTCFHLDFVWFTSFVSSSVFVNRIHVVCLIVTFSRRWS